MSRITPKQIQVIQIARRQLGLDEADYREILRQIGRVESSKHLTQRGFEDVMAHFEHRGFNRTFSGQRAAGGGQREGFTRDHFRQRKWHRGIFASAREVHLIRELIQSVGYKLPGLCLRFSGDRTDDVTKLNPREARNLIEMLKSKQAAGSGRQAAIANCNPQIANKTPRAAEGSAARVAKDGAGTDAGPAPRRGRDVTIGSPTGWGACQPDDFVPF